MLKPSTSLSKHCDISVACMVSRVKQGLLPVQVLSVTNDVLKSCMKVDTLFTDIEVGHEVGQCRDSEGGALHPWTVDTLMRQFGVEEEGFSPRELKAARHLLHQNISVYSQGETELGRTHLTLHGIDTGDAKPFKMRP